MHTSEEPQNHRRRLLVHITCTAPPASYRSRPCHAFSMTKERGAFHKASFVSVSINTKIGPRMLYWRPALIGQCLWGQPAHMNSLKGSKMAWLAVVDDGTHPHVAEMLLHLGGQLQRITRPVVISPVGTLYRKIRTHGPLLHLRTPCLFSPHSARACKADADSLWCGVVIVYSPTWPSLSACSLRKRVRKRRRESPHQPPEKIEVCGVQAT